MSLNRIFRYLFGVLFAAILLAVILPFVGVPKSHYLPPAWVYNSAQGLDKKGIITGKYYQETGNPFRIGDHLYFFNYKFHAHTPPSRGAATPGPMQVYQGTVRVDQSTYEQLKNPNTQSATIHAGDVVALAPVQIPVRYETTYPYINGADTPWGSRSITEGSALFSGWLIWIAVALALGYFFMLGLERFSSKENI